LEVVHIANDDYENLFAYILRTPVNNNKGLPHILEHSTLCGSRAFPLKDPFMMLLKGSMHTFLNALTGPDATYYVASSTVPEDFYNLMLVYGDAVFNPLLKEEVLLQEGFHYEVDAEGQPQIVGIVYNEMKGNYSSMESLASDWSVRSLFTNNTYAYDSGGDPQAIPELTYAEFCDFHKNYYHPSNCRIFLYGNIDTTQQLLFFQENFLKVYSQKKAVQSFIGDQARWQTPRQFKIPFQANPPLEKTSSILVNWLTTSISDPFTMLKLEFLSEILLGNAGSPLRKGLVESHLGEDISPASGLETSVKELIFSVGIRGTDPDKEQPLIDTIFRILNSIIENGLEDKLIEAALHRIEFRKRELPTSNPYGIGMLFRSIRGWIHDLAPEVTLEYDKWIVQLKQCVNEDKHFYKALIRQYLIANQHRSTVILYPDNGQEDQEKYKAQLQKLAAQPDKIATMKEKFERLTLFQEQPDKPEDLVKIPTLQISDLPKTITTIPFETMTLPDNSTLFQHDIHTSNIIYLDFAFDLSPLDQDSLVYLPLFCKMLTSCALPGKSYDQVANLLSLYTGGIQTSLSAETTVDGFQKLYLIVTVKFLADKCEPALSLFYDLLFKADFSDYAHTKDNFFEIRNKFRASIIPHGSFYADLRAASKISPVLEQAEQWYGLEQYLFLNTCVAGLDHALDKNIALFYTLKQQLLCSTGLLINLACDKKHFPVIRAALSQRGFVPCKGELARVKDTRRTIANQVESVFTSSTVNFVARAIHGALIGTKQSSVESVLTHLLNTGYLWDKIRVIGGAYGASASSYSLQGVYTFSSFRDPQITTTLDTFKQGLQFIADGNFSPDELRLAIIGTIGKHEKPIRGAQKGYINLKRIICGITDTLRQEQRDVVLNLKKEELQECAANLLAGYANGASVIVTSKEEMEKVGSVPGHIIELPV